MMNRVSNFEEKLAVVLVNLGSPDAPTVAALRRYLAEFLSDRRVIDLPRWYWLPILHGIVLRVRPRRSALLYQNIWTEAGSPLLLITEQQAFALQEATRKRGLDVVVDYAMRYGNPSLSGKLQALKARGVSRILFIPMYPQYSDATTASVIDAVAAAFRKMRYMPDWRFVHHWHTHPQYIQALADSVRRHIDDVGMPEKLLVSFHGVPQRYADEGDPYYLHCVQTVRSLREALVWPEERVAMVFQSRFGNEVWLQPYADAFIREQAEKGLKKLAVICPGFTADCLETLEEMAITNRELFLHAGGESYTYVPALNADAAHMDLLLDLVLRHTSDWGLSGSERRKEG